MNFIQQASSFRSTECDKEHLHMSLTFKGSVKDNEFIPWTALLIGGRMLVCVEQALDTVQQVSYS